VQTSPRWLATLIESDPRTEAMSWHFSVRGIQAMGGPLSTKRCLGLDAPVGPQRCGCGRGAGWGVWKLHSSVCARSETRVVGDPCRRERVSVVLPAGGWGALDRAKCRQTGESMQREWVAQSPACRDAGLVASRGCLTGNWNRPQHHKGSPFGRRCLFVGAAQWLLVGASRLGPWLEDSARSSTDRP
jgi:hypothetical protein